MRTLNCFVAMAQPQRELYVKEPFDRPHEVNGERLCRNSACLDGSGRAIKSDVICITVVGGPVFERDCKIKCSRWVWFGQKIFS